MKLTVLEFLKRKKESLNTKKLAFSSKTLAKDMRLSLWHVKKQLACLRKSNRVKWTHGYDDTNYCNCFNENQNFCECPESEPFDRVAWFWEY